MNPPIEAVPRPQTERSRWSKPHLRMLCPGYWQCSKNDRGNIWYCNANTPDEAYALIADHFNLRVL